MDEALYRKLMLESSVLQGIAAVASGEAEKEFREQGHNLSKRLLNQAQNHIILGHYHSGKFRDPRSYEDRYSERVRQRAGEIFWDYISRLDILKKLKKAGYKFAHELGDPDWHGWQRGNH